MVEEPTRRSGVAIAGVLVLGAGLCAAWRLHGLGLLGPDTYPLILAARDAPLAGLFEPLFGGAVPAPYYRPVLHASFVLDHALHGLTPAGWHATGVALFALAGVGLAALARALGLGAVGLAAALLFFLLHPVHGVVVPVPARRADLLCALFLLLAVAAQLRATRAGRRFAWQPVLWAALAMGSKETGLAAPLLCALAAAVAPLRGSPRERTLAALRAAVPLLVLLALAWGLRVVVLGDGLGGRPIRTGGLLRAFAATGLRVFDQAISARAVWPDTAFPRIPLVAAVGLVVFTLLRCDAPLRRRLSAELARSIALATGALLTFAAGYALGGQLQPWYLLVPAAFVACALGGAAQAMADARGGRGLRPAALVAGLALLATALPAASRSFLVDGVEGWQRADRLTRRYLDGLGRAVRAAPPGSRVVHRAPPAFAGDRRTSPRGVVVLAPYRAAAWTRLGFPDATADADESGIVVVRGGPAAPRPNVVVVIADDLGFADLGFQGSREIATPNLDRLAREGVRFSDAYVTSPLCAPTRAALLTGRDPNRFGYTTATGTFQEQVRNDTGVPTSEVLLSQRLRQAGYATAAVGKWHLGVRPPYRPLRRGFDSFFGFLAGTHAYFDWGPGLYGPVFRDDRRVRGEGYLTDAFAEEAEQIIEGAGDAPFFLYVAFHAVHAPFEAPERHRDTYAHLEPPERAAVAAMTAALDDGVGRILDALDRTGRADDTLVWFLNDNGGLPPVSSNAPLRGGKGDLFEGGIRVPFVLRWPARLAPGTSDLPVSVLDVFPTVAAAAGLPEGDRPLDGADLLPSLAGGPPPARPALHWRYDASRAIRRGPWKLLERDGEALLFDLAQDPGETRDLAAEHPRRVAELSRDLDAWESEVAERP